MSASTSRKRKNQPVEKPRPSVFDRLGTKANQPQQQAESSRTNFCHHWRDTGNCPFGANCKNAAFHALISPSKRAKGSDKDLQSKDQSNRKETGRGKKGKGKEWSELDEGELERRKQQLQKELDLQNRQEMKKKSNKKQQKRSSSSSSTSSTQSSSNTSKNSSVKSSQPKPRKPRNRKRKGKGGAGGGGGVAAPKPQPKEADPKRMRDPPKDIKKRSNSASRQDQRSRSKHRTSGSATKKRKNSTSSENSSMERRRQQSKSSSHQSKGKARSPTPDRKKKQPPATYDKKSPPRRRDSPGNRRSSPGRGSNRKRSVSPRPRRRTPSPRGKVDKKHVESRNNSPVVSCRQRSPSPEKKEGRRAQTPPSPHDRGHPRGGRGSRRNSPEPRGQLRDRNRAQGARSPDRRNRGHSREPRESAVDKRDRRDHCSPLPSKSHVGRISPDNSVRPSSRDRRDARDDSSRDKGRSNKESDRDRRRDGGQEKGRDRGRACEDELPSLMNIMTQHPAQYSPRRGRDEPQDYRGSNRDRGRHERFEERGDAFPPADDHPRGSKRPRRESPVRQRSSQKGGRDWSDHPEQRDKDWERRGKGGGNSSHREWDDPSRQRSGGKGSHRRGPSPVPASPKIPKEIEERPIDENKGDEKCDDKRAEKQVEEDIADSQSKKIAQEGDDSGTRNLDQAESDFSDFSDDADDILNADVVEDEPVEVIEAEENQNSAMGGADGDKDEDEQVEDILDDMDFEEISDGELDAEDIKAGADALSVDWAALLNQTRQTKREETDSFVNRWDIGSALSRIGVPLSVKGKFDLSSIGLQPPDKDAKSKIEGGKMRAAFLFDEDNKIQDEVPGVHAAIVLKKEEIANILNPKYHRGIDFAYGDQLRKICPFKNSETTGVAPFNEGLHQLALDMLRGSCDPNDVQQRINSCIVKSEV